MSNCVFQKVLEIEGQKRNLTEQEKLRLVSWAKNVGEIESNNNPIRTQGDDPEGIGRGKYQFESNKGSGTARVAANRLKNWEKANGQLDISEEDRKELNKKDPDFSKLSEDTQDAVFMIHHSMHPKTPLTGIAKGEVPQAEAWVNYHWAGSKEEAPQKYEMWKQRIVIPQQAAVANTFPEAMQ